MAHKGLFAAAFLLACMVLEIAPADAQCGNCRFTGGSTFSCSSGTGSGKVLNSQCFFGQPCGGGECCKVCSGPGPTSVIDLFGNADGGSVDLFVEGFTFSYSTSAMQSASDIAQGLAALVNSNPIIGTPASAQGGRLTISNADEVYIRIIDPGLNSVNDIPSLGQTGFLALAVLLGGTGILWLRRLKEERIA